MKTLWLAISMINSGPYPSAVEVGEQIQMGQQKTIYEMKKQPQKVIAIPKELPAIRPRDNSLQFDCGESFGMSWQQPSYHDIQCELENLSLLEKAGLPVPRVFGTTYAFGRLSYVMERFPFASKDKGANDAMIIARISLDCLMRYRRIIQEKAIEISDLQFLANTDGTLVFSDPGRVTIGAGKQQVDETLKNLDAFIMRVKSHNHGK